MDIARGTASSRSRLCRILGLIFLTGATGFLGERVARYLVGAGHKVRCFVRPASNRSILADLNLEYAVGDLADEMRLAASMKGWDTLVNVASIGFGHGPGIVRAAERAGVRRAIFFSTTAIFTRLPAQTKAARLEAEQAIIDSSLDWTILRPTMIYGSPRDRNMWRLINYLKRYPLLPIPGNGQSLQQPVFVDDVAQATAVALATQASIGKALNLAGAEPLSYNEVIDTVAGLLGRRVLKLHVPLPVALLGLRAYNALRRRAALRSEQLLRLNEDKAFSIHEARACIGYEPLTFSEGISRELQAVRRTASVAS
jgi:nucleoside-diphosphate-sugar epimerase